VPDEEKPVDSSAGVPAEVPSMESLSGETQPTSSTESASDGREAAEKTKGVDEEQTAGATEDAPSFPVPLREASLEYFQSLPGAIRQKILTTLWRKYSSVLELMLQSANTAVEGYHAASSNYKKWRIWLISATGMLAIINVIGAYDLQAVFPPNYAALVTVMKSYLSLTAAVVAATIALFSNIESFLNYAELRSTQRQTRELFLDGFRDFESLWHIHVAPFGFGAQACYNATFLYRRLIERDRELRRKLATDLKTTATQAAGAGPGT
jgi:hypothetical protein